MRAYKGFNKNLECTMGKGVFKYEIGQTYKEDSAQCAKTGFHCVEEPIEVLRWYENKTDRYCIVEAGGDINEDGNDRISCTEMRIVREISLKQLGLLECDWIMNHPYRKCSDKIMKNTGEAKAGEIVIVRGKNPKAAGEKGAVIFLLKEEPGLKDIMQAGVYKIDGKKYKSGVFYDVEGRERKCKKKHYESYEL